MARSLVDRLGSRSINVELVDLANFETPVDQSGNDDELRVIHVQPLGEQLLELRPLRFDFDKAVEHIKQLASSVPVVVVHGLYALYDKRLRDMASLKVFVSVDPDTRLVRWIRRDVVKGSELLSCVLNFYIDSARQEMSDFIEPTKQLADIITLGAEESALLIVDGIGQQLGEKPVRNLPKTNVLRPRYNSFFDAS